MLILQWQLQIAGQPIKPGASLDILRRWQNKNGIHIEIRPVGIRETWQVRVQSIVNIGGKNYLLLADTNDTLSVVRLLDGSRLCAMDPDRFSSLSNALHDFVTSNTVTTSDTFEKALGQVPTVHRA